MLGDKEGKRDNKFADGDGQRAQVFVHLRIEDCFMTRAKHCIITNLKGNNKVFYNGRLQEYIIFVTRGRLVK